MSYYAVNNNITLNADIYKRLAKLSNFNIDPQARWDSNYGTYQYRAVCTECNVALPISSVGNLNPEFNPALKDFCVQHRHIPAEAVTFQVYEEGVVSVSGRKFKDNSEDNIEDA